MSLTSPIQFSIWSVVLAIGVVQGFLLSNILIIQKKGQIIANRFLAILLFSISLILTEYVFSLSGLLHKWPHLLNATFPLWFFIGPLLYFYSRSVLSKPTALEWRTGLHFIPTFICIIVFSRFYILPGSDKLTWLYAHNQNELPIRQLFLLMMYMIQTLTYGFIMIRMLRGYSNSFKHVSSSNNIIQIDWLKRLVAGFVLYLTCDMIVTIIMLFFKSYVFIVEYVSLLILSTFIYMVGYKAILHPNQLFPRLNVVKEKYQKSSLNGEMAKIKLKNIQDIMETKRPYLNPELKLADLANSLGLSENHLSQVINQELGWNFYDFINEYRVKEAQQRLLDPSQKNYTVLAIALDVGFNSNASFYRTFKKFCGISPAAFRKSSLVHQAS